MIEVLIQNKNDTNCGKIILFILRQITNYFHWMMLTQPSWK